MRADRTTRNILLAARALLAEKRYWTRAAAYAVDAAGHDTETWEPCDCPEEAQEPARWTLAGALLDVCDFDRERSASDEAFRRVYATLGLDLPRWGTRELQKWNNAPGRTHAEVPAALDAAARGSYSRVRGAGERAAYGEA